MTRDRISDPSGVLPDKKEKSRVSRRDFLKGAAVSAIALAGSAANGAAEAAADTPGPGTITTKPGARWGMIIDSEKCVRARACMMACKVENNTPPGVDYNVTVEEEKGIYPDVHHRYIFRPCNHCEYPSCTYVCPTQATFKREEDGIVVIDYDKCIGCRYCIAACPYCARSFDYGHYFNHPPAEFEKMPSPEYKQNRVREGVRPPVNSTRKCSFCLHRISEGLAPACATSCPQDVIHFGDLNDPDAKCWIHGESMRELLRTRSSFRIKEELGNEPNVFYLT